MGTAPNRTRWQRERMVGSSALALVQIRMKPVPSGGSSRVLSRALAAAACMASAGSTTTKRRRLP